MDEQALLAAIGQMMDQKLEQALQPISKQLDAVDERLETMDQRLDTMDQRLDSVDKRLGALEHTSEVLMIGVRLANSKLHKITAVQEYTIDQLEFLDEVKMDNDPLRKKRA